MPAASSSSLNLPLIVTAGEPAGVGGELLLMAVAKGEGGLITIDDPARLTALCKRGGIDLHIYETDGTNLADSKNITLANSPNSLGVIPITWPQSPEFGTPSTANAKQVIANIKQGVMLAQNRQVAGIVTCPIQKASLYAAGFRYHGHTEYLAALDASDDRDQATPLMMLACHDIGLRIVPLTIHIPLSEVTSHITEDKIYRTLHTMHTALIQDFAIHPPRIYTAGLNPHAGEDGTIGREETTIIAPAIARAVADGLHIKGPYSADTLFTKAMQNKYDAVLAMYHDQALIPIKTLAFDTAVNITLGLRFIRTSPDHGTALDIAGSFTASPTSLMAAIQTARLMYAHRHANTHV